VNRGEEWGSVGTCRHLWASVGIFGGLWGSVWLHTLRHSAIWLWGPASSPVLQPLAPGKIISRTGRTMIHSPSWSYPQDGVLPRCEHWSGVSEFSSPYPNGSLTIPSWQFSQPTRQCSAGYTVDELSRLASFRLRSSFTISRPFSAAHKSGVWPYAASGVSGSAFLGAQTGLQIAC